MSKVNDQPDRTRTQSRPPALTQYSNRSLEKAFRILDLFDSQRVKLRLSDIGRELDLSPSSLYPILGTLESHGYLERDPDRKYSLGWKLLERSRMITESLDVRSQAKPHLKAIASDCRVNAHLAVLRDWQVLYLDREVAGTEVVFPSIVGHRVPSHCTALGKVLLAHLDAAQQEEFLRESMFDRLTAHTIVDSAELKRELDDVAQRGWAVDHEEFQYGVICVAAPIRDHEGRVVAAMSVSFSTNRASDESIRDFTERLQQDAAQVSRELGFRAEREQPSSAGKEVDTSTH